MLKSDQSVLRLELEEDKAQSDYVYAALPAYDTHNNEVSLSVCVGQLPSGKFRLPPLAQQCATTFQRRGRGGPTQIDSSNGRIYVLKQPI